MKRIYRYTIYPLPEQEITINALVEDGVVVHPRTQVLKIDTIRDEPSMWCLIDTDMPTTEIKLKLYGTGWELPDTIDSKNYLGSFIWNDSEIYHIFFEG